MRGDWEDYEILADGSRRLVARGQNLIVNTAFIAIAMAVKQDATLGGLYWAVGDGNTTDSASWDAGIADGSIAPVATDTGLRNETFRKLIDPADITFVDGANNPSATPTNRLRVRVLFQESEPSDTEAVTLREWSIFGGDASGNLNTGFAINHKLHVSFVKSNLSQLERILFLTF